MKVLMTADTIGGVWTFAMELIGSLESHGVEVALATMGRSLSPDQRLQAAQHRNLTLFSSSYKLEWMNQPWDDVDRAGRWLLQLRNTFRPDVVHLNTYVHGAMPWGVPTVITAHSCMTSWWAAVRQRSLPLRRAVYRDAVQTGLHAVDEIVTPTAAMAETMQHLYDLPRRPTVIHNGRSSELFKPGAKHPFVLSCGRFWDEAKNLAALDKAAAGLPWPVYVAGPLQHPDRLAAAPAYNARLLGMLPLMHMRQWMSRADIYALPARYEPFGLSVLEAALCGCCMVLGDIASLRELWDDAAVFVPPDDTSVMQQKMIDLIKNPKLRRQLAFEARSRALTLTPQRQAEAYVALYQRVFDSSTSTTAMQTADLSGPQRSELLPS